MKRIEASAILTACVPLANRLAAEGIYVILTAAEKTVLANFYQVVLDGWLNDPKVYQEAGLRQLDIKMLGIKAARTLAEEMWQHAAGEQLE